MTRLRFQIYYEYNGPTKGDLFRAQKSKEDIDFALSRVQTELEMFLWNDQATVQVTDRSSETDSIIIDIVSPSSEEEVLQQLARCIGNLDLFGERLPLMMQVASVA